MMEFHTQPTRFGIAVYIKNLDIQKLDIEMAKYGYKQINMPSDYYPLADRYYHHPIFGMAMLKQDLLVTTTPQAQRHIQQLVMNQDIEWIWHV